MLADLPAARFLASRPVLIPDMLGYRMRASVRPETISLHSQAEDLAAQIVAGGYARAHIVGHSVGGAVSMLLARHTFRFAVSDGNPIRSRKIIARRCIYTTPQYKLETWLTRSETRRNY